jgi:hypothetical protein
MIKDFSKNDWDHLHDIILDVTYDGDKLSLDRCQLMVLFDELPEELKEDAYRWGMSDTSWCDSVWEWYVENKL